MTIDMCGVCEQLWHCISVMEGIDREMCKVCVVIKGVAKAKTTLFIFART